MTDVPIMLPAKLPDELDKPAIDRYGSENHEEYLIVFPFGPTETVTSVSNAEMLGTLRAYPKEEDVANEFFDAEKIEKTKLPDGTEATLRYMVPAGRTGSQGPFWEGKFDKKEYTYVLTVIKPYEITKDEVKQALSSMVLVRRSEGEPTTGGTPSPPRPRLSHRNPPRPLPRRPRPPPPPAKVPRRQKPRYKRRRRTTTKPQEWRTGTTPTITWMPRPGACSPGTSGSRRTSGSQMMARSSTT